MAQIEIEKSALVANNTNKVFIARINDGGKTEIVPFTHVAKNEYRVIVDLLYIKKVEMTGYNTKTTYYKTVYKLKENDTITYKGRLPSI